ncbi:IclR family transcriptional regulator [Glutamicibacter sp. NPDC087344]|uniref:IclR family transcriptional regulator n=1 Tax=Glutamicibacter sp. NPDC087344 TaxID=3363994 RepID=UPI00382DE874
MENATGSKTLERGLELLELVASGYNRLDDVARLSGISRSSAHRMLSSLVAKKYLTLSVEHHYKLGVKLLELGSQAEASLDLPAEVQGMLQDISLKTRETCHLGVLDGTEVLYLAKSRGSRGVEMASRPGSRFQTQTTAMGKMLLSFEPRETALAQFDPERTVTEFSIKTAAEFEAELAQIRERGYALDKQENELGLICVAIAIRDRQGAPVASVSISAPSVYMTEERISELVELLNTYEPEFSRRLPPHFRDLWL